MPPEDLRPGSLADLLEARGDFDGALEAFDRATAAMNPSGGRRDAVVMRKLEKLRDDPDVAPEAEGRLWSR